MEYKCSVCLGGLFSVRDEVSVIKCGHMYHKECLKNCMRNSTQCPICKVRITKVVETLYPDAHDDISCSSCSKETKEFLEEVYDNDREKRLVFVKKIKKLDKENTNLKEAHKNYQDNLKTIKVYLKCFEDENKELQKKNKNKEVENKALLAEIKKAGNNHETKNVSEKSKVKNEVKTSNYSLNDICYNIKAMSIKGLFI